MSVLEKVQRHRIERRQELRANAIGADLIPRAHPSDPRYAGVDLAARGRDLDALRIGMARLTISVADVSMELRAAIDRIAQELRVAGAEELGRWATDLIYAYSEVPSFPEPNQLAAYEAWRRALQLHRSDPVSGVVV